MKTLYLIRHAPAAAETSLPDHDRPLSEEGVRVAFALGTYMHAERLVPNVVLCSTARRARETWEHMRGCVGGDAAIIYEEQLYGASGERILEVMARVGDSAERVLLVAHNPGVEELVGRLAASPDGGGSEGPPGGYAAGALAVLEADVTRWRELKPGGCALERFVEPRDLPDPGERDR